jgi:hypothetical protein
MNYSKILLFALALILISCEPDVPVIQTPTSTEIDFSNLKVGQHSQFQLFQGQCDQDAYFTGDTMNLEVIQMGSNLVFRESFTAESATYSENESVEYIVIDQGAYLLIPDRFSSNLFFFYGNDTLWKNPTAEVELTKEGCFLQHENGDFFVGEEIGHLAHLDIGVETKQDLKVVSCVPFFQLDAYLSYTRNGLEVSYYIQPGIIDQPTIIGWTKMN